VAIPPLRSSSLATLIGITSSAKLACAGFHTGEIYAALSASTAELTVEAVKAAKKHARLSATI